MAAVKVIMGKIIHDKKHYNVGMVVTGLNDEERARVIKAKIGVACSDDELDDEVVGSAANKNSYTGHILTKAEKDKLDKEKVQLK